MNLKNIPKVELHLHLDGSVRLDTASKLTGKSIEEVRSLMIAKEKCHDLNEYLTKFNLANEIMQSQENLIRIAKELVEDLKNDNVIYAEVRFAPLLHTKKGLTGEKVIEAVLLGLKDEDLKVNLILCMMRQFNFEDNLKTIELASKYLDKGVVAIDLAGAEALYPTASFEKLFQIAKDKNIPFTIHAGEADGKDSILSAINFKTKRIGHGVRCIEDNETLNIIKKNNITLEVCPTSNIQTGIFENYYDHPIKKLYDMNVLVTINVDNMTVSNIDLTQEYEKLVKIFNLNIEDLKKINLNAIDAAFLTDKEKQFYKIIINNYKNNC
mgnify:CR=1 FL=1